MSASFLAEVDPAQRLEACGEAPGNVCRFVFDRTESVGFAEFANWLTGTPLEIILVILGAWVINRLIRRLIRRFARRIEGRRPNEHLQKLRDRTPAIFLDTGGVNMRAAARAQTIAIVLQSVCSGLVWTFAFIYVLEALGLALGPLLAGAGVAGVALGFGAQSLVRDFLSGIFMLIEDQYGVGDVVDLGEAVGTVEQVSLRSTRLRAADGTVWHVPNGQVIRVGNHSQQWARAVVDVNVAPEADLDQAVAVMLSAAEEVWDRDDAVADVMERPEVLGIEYLGPDAVTIRVQGKTRPGAQWRVSRMLRVRIAEALRAADIPMPPANFMRPFSR